MIAETMAGYNMIAILTRLVQFASRIDDAVEVPRGLSGSPEADRTKHRVFLGRGAQITPTFQDSHSCPRDLWDAKTTKQPGTYLRPTQPFTGLWLEMISGRTVLKGKVKTSASCYHAK